MFGKAIGVFEDGGLILGEDNRKYKYKNVNVKNVAKLAEEQRVQFVPRIDEAIDIVAAKKTINLKDEKNQKRKTFVSPPGAKLAGFGTILQFLLVVPVIGFVFYVLGITIQLLGVKKLAHHKEQKRAYTMLLKGLYSGLFVIFIMLALIFYFGLELLELEIEQLPSIVWILFSLLVLNSIYSTIMGYRALSTLGKEYNCDILASTAWLHALFLLLVPFGVGLVVFYVYIIILSIALFNLKSAHSV